MNIDWCDVEGWDAHLFMLPDKFLVERKFFTHKHTFEKDNNVMNL